MQDSTTPTANGHQVDNRSDVAKTLVELANSHQNIRQEVSSALLARGVYPGRRKYSHVRPRGLYMFSPWAWRAAKQLEHAEDYSYREIMTYTEIALAKQKISVLNQLKCL